MCNACSGSERAVEDDKVITAARSRPRYVANAFIYSAQTDSFVRPLKVLFVEPPKDTWFVMGEYLPPPLGI
ncbi:MAG: hypothetical protein ACXV2F_07050, partial [Halobacteriota archaeon]